jgi:RNA polymerase sigma-70 factor (ECF subfamily)
MSTKPFSAPEALSIQQQDKTLPPPTGATPLRDRYRAHEKDEDMLLAGVRAGDIEAFEVLYKKYHVKLSKFLLRIVSRPQLAEDVINETMLVVWEKASAFNGASKLSTWIFAIAYRKGMKALRRHEAPIEDKQAEERASPEASPEEETAHGRLRLMLAKAMEELSADHRTVIELTYFHELGYREISEIMGCPVDTVKTRMFHARRQLRRRLPGQLPDWL